MLSPRQRRRALGAAGATRFADAVGFSIFLTVGPLLARHYGTGPALATALLAIYPLVGVVLSPVLGSLSDRHGRRPIILAGIAINMAGYVWLARADSLGALCAARLLSGFGASNAGAAGSVFSDLSTDADRPQMMARRSAAYAVGILLGPLVGAPLFSVGHDLVGYAVAALLLVNLILAARWLPETRRGDRSKPGLRPFALLSGRAVDGPVRQMLLTAGVITLGFSLVYSVLPLVAARFVVTRTTGPLSSWMSGGSSLGQAVNLTAFLTVTTTIVTIVSQLSLAAPIINRRGEMATVRLFIVVWSASFGLGALTQRLGLLPFAVVVAVAGLAYGVLYPSISTYITRCAARDRQGYALGSLDSTVALSTALGPAVSGLLFSWSPVAPFWAAVALMGLGYRSTPRRPAPAPSVSEAAP
jgi:MFS transporter, DHA1 family, tetracycline resistance protein